MDQAIRNKLRSVVTQCRRLLEESIAQQLQGRYDIYATGKKDEVRAEKVVPLDHLTDEERQARHDILAHFEHITALGYKPREALEQLIREIAFTHLNRLCAYKMMEVRDVYVGGQRFREAVGKGLKSQGFLFYLADHPEDERLFNAGGQEEAYRRFLNWLGGTLSQEIGVLFSPTDPANRVYPPQRVLDKVLDLLNSEELKGIWSEDETIGWVYQYFTPKELRDQARKESQAPRNSYELAFRNQFFTPRYVVEFLTDNTLGRIWYEMRQGRTRLADECRYMVRRPDEVFLARMTSPDEEYPQEACVEAARLLSEGDEASFPPFDESDESIRRMIAMAHVVSAYDRHGDEAFALLNREDDADFAERMSEQSTQSILDRLFLTCRADRHGGGWGNVYAEPWFIALANEVRRRALTASDPDLKTEERLRLPVFIPHRAKKDPREIKILDPACGSGHFLLYAFGLLLTIYEEAHDDPDLGPALRADYPTKDDLRRALPGLILRHNLHGVDIDLRCAQIAALALWLRCQRAYQEMGLKKDRPPILKANVVCAEPMPGEKALLDEFLKTLREDRLEALIRQVMNVPKDQRVRATRGMVESLSDLVRTVWDKMRLAGEAGSLLKIEEDLRDAIRKGQDEWEERLPLFRVTEYGLSERPREQLVRLVPGDVDGVSVTFWDKAETLVRRALDEFVTFASNGGRFQRQLFVEDAQQGLGFVDVCRQRYDVLLMNPPFGLGLRSHYEWLKKAYPDGYVDIFSSFVCRAAWMCGGKVGIISSRSVLMTKKLQRIRANILVPGLEILEDLGWPVMDGAMVQSCAYVYDAQGKPASRFFLTIDRRHCTDKGDFSPGDASLKVNVADRFAFASMPQQKLLYDLPGRALSLLKSPIKLGQQVLIAKLGMKSFNDFRFLRLRAEISPENIGEKSLWEPLSKGGPYALFHADLPLLIKWCGDGEEVAQENMRANGQTAQARQASKYYRLAGGTYSRRAKDFGVRVLPSGCIIGEKGPAILPMPDYSNQFVIGLLNSRLMNSLIHAQANAKQFDSGIIEALPWVDFDYSGPRF